MKIQSRQKAKNNLRSKLMFAALSAAFILSIALIFIDLTEVKNPARASDRRSSKLEIRFTDNAVPLNKKVIDARPLISHDGTSLFLGRRNSEENIGGKKDFQDIWYTKLDESGNWGKIVNLGEIINNEKGNGICSINPEGNEIIITNEYDRTITTPIAISKLMKGKWTTPEAIEIEEYYNNNKFEDFFMAYSENKLFSASERTDGFGDQDLYFSVQKDSNKWSKPINLGSIINSNKADFAPFLAADGRTLFFASSREGGFGKSDIYVSKRLDDTWTNWSEPKNLGPEINTPNEENYFSVSSKLDKIYIESYSTETNERRIFEVVLHENPAAAGHPFVMEKGDDQLLK